MRMIFKRIVVAIAEPVAVAVAAAVEQTLSQQDGRVKALQEQLAQCQLQLREARREHAALGDIVSEYQDSHEAALALARLAGKVVNDFCDIGRAGALPSEQLVMLRKLDQLADVVLGQS